MVMLVGLTVAICILQMLCLASCFWCVTEVKAFQKSTHQIQFVPAENQFQKITDDIKESLTKDIFDNVN